MEVWKLPSEQEAKMFWPSGSISNVHTKSVYNFVYSGKPSHVAVSPYKDIINLCVQEVCCVCTRSPHLFHLPSCTCVHTQHFHLVHESTVCCSNGYKYVQQAYVRSLVC